MAENPLTQSKINKKLFKFGQWNVIVHSSHILQSRCDCDLNKAESVDASDSSVCDFCKFEKELELPQLPEMTYANNLLHVEHKDRFGIEFNALDALKVVDSKNDLIKVAVANLWQESRVDDPRIKEVVKPFDWTFSTEYKGTLFGDNKLLQVYETEERINMEKLKVKEKILFYEDVRLFEDELADNGVAECSVKIRIMPDSFFILLRYFLRVDDLLVRIIDTRIYYEENLNYLLREHMMKECKIRDFKGPPALLLNPQELWNHLPIVKFKYEKLQLP